MSLVLGEIDRRKQFSWQFNPDGVRRSGFLPLRHAAQSFKLFRRIHVLPIRKHSKQESLKASIELVHIGDLAEDRNFILRTRSLHVLDLQTLQCFLVCFQKVLRPHLWKILTQKMIETESKDITDVYLHLHLKTCSVLSASCFFSLSCFCRALLLCSCLFLS